MINPKILIVEDESIVALDIKNTIKKLGYEVVGTATNYNDAIKYFKLYSPDIVMMDINLEKSKDGIETATDILKIKNVQIIYLTAFSDDETICRAIQTDPAAYLLKPFSREEIKTNIQLCIYKNQNKKQNIMKTELMDLGLGYQYSPIKGTLFYQDIPIRLSSNENKLLKLLVDAKGNIVPFEDIEYEIWPEAPVSNSSLRTLIYRLRGKLEYKLIETVQSFGCKIKL